MSDYGDRPPVVISPDTAIERFAHVARTARAEADRRAAWSIYRNLMRARHGADVGEFAADR